MAKSLSRCPPSSTVARLLDASAAARAVGAPASAAPTPAGDDWRSPPPQDRPIGEGREGAGIKRELTLSAATDETLSQLIDVYRRATGARLSASHFVRAMLIGVARCLPALQREANRIGPLKLPGNARGYGRKREEFERRLARAFLAGVRAGSGADEI